MIRSMLSLVVLAGFAAAAPVPAVAEGTWLDRSQQWSRENSARVVGEPMTRATPRFSNRAGARDAAADPASARQQCLQQCASTYNPQLELCSNGQTFNLIRFCRQGVSRQIQNCTRRC